MADFLISHVFSAGKPTDGSDLNDNFEDVKNELNELNHFISDVVYTRHITDGSITQDHLNIVTITEGEDGDHHAIDKDFFEAKTDNLYMSYKSDNVGIFTNRLLLTSTIDEDILVWGEGKWGEKEWGSEIVFDLDRTYHVTGNGMLHFHILQNKQSTTTVRIHIAPTEPEILNSIQGGTGEENEMVWKVSMRRTSLDSASAARTAMIPLPNHWCWRVEVTGETDEIVYFLEYFPMGLGGIT